MSFLEETENLAKINLKLKTSGTLPELTIVSITVFQSVRRPFRQSSNFVINIFKSDMKTLSRMTGKDFSGPVPEIRIPLPMPPPTAPTEGEGNASNSVPVENTSLRVKKRSRSRSHGGTESGVLVLGDADTFEG